MSSIRFGSLDKAIADLFEAYRLQRERIGKQLQQVFIDAPDDNNGPVRLSLWYRKEQLWTQQPQSMNALAAERVQLQRLRTQTAVLCQRPSPELLSLLLRWRSAAVPSGVLADYLDDHGDDWDCQRRLLIVTTTLRLWERGLLRS